MKINPPFWKKKIWLHILFSNLNQNWLIILYEALWYMFYTDPIMGYC